MRSNPRSATHTCSKFSTVSSSQSFAEIRIFSSGQSFSISPSNECSGLIFFRTDWFDLLAVQGTLKSLFQHQFESINSLALNYLYGPTLTSIYDYWEKNNIAITIWIVVCKVMSLLFNMLSRLVITFLPRSKRLLISWLQSLSAVILEPPKIKFLTVSVSPSIHHAVMGPDAMTF